MAASAPKTPESLPDEGIVTTADARLFPSLALLCHSVLETYPVPVVCFDAGLTEEQKDWIRESLPTCTVSPVPEHPTLPVEAQADAWSSWLRPFLIAASPFRRTIWLDSDLAVLRGLGELFTRLDAGPIFTPESRDPSAAPNPPELYELLPVDRPFDRLRPLVNAGVSSWDLERDAALLELYRLPIVRAGSDAAVRDSISRRDHGALLWAIQRLGLEACVLRATKWNLGVASSDSLRDTYPSDVDELVEELREDFPEACLLHWNGSPAGESLWTRVPDREALLRSVATRAPGRRRPRPAGPKAAAAVKLVCMMGVKSSPHLVAAFLEHYYRLGVDAFLIVLHREAGDPRGERVRQILRGYGSEPLLEAPLFSARIKQGYFSDIVQAHCSPDDWIVYADLDELQVFPAPLPELLASCDELGYTFVRGELVDRLAEGGELVPIEPGAPIWEQFPYTAAATGQVATGWTRKVCVARGRLRPGEGAHSFDYGSDPLRNYLRTHRDPRGYPQTIRVHHFKWDATLVQRTHEKVDLVGGDQDSIDGAGFMHEYRGLLDHVERFGRVAIDGMTFSGTPEFHYVRPQPPQSSELASPRDPTTPVERAAVSLRGGFSNSRHALLRALRPYAVRREELDRAIVDCLQELERRQAATEALLANLESRRHHGR